MQATTISTRRKPHLFAFILTLVSIGLFLVTSPAQAQNGPAGQPLDTPLSETIDTDKLDDALGEALATSGPNTEHEVVVVYNDTSVLSLLAPLTSVLHKLRVLPVTGMILTSSEIGNISLLPGVSYIALNRELEYFVHESVPMIGADQVWNTYGQRGGDNTVRVAVIDSGIDALHPDLPFGDKVIQNALITPLAVPVENLPLTDVAFGHGTHVAGTIAGTGAASDGYYQGVAPDVEIVGLGSGLTLTLLAALQSYDWVLEHADEYNIRIVNSSWGTSGGELDINDPIVMATYEAYKRGILSVFPAGNQGGNDSLNPYSLAPWVLSVAAGDKNGNLAGFSSRGLNGDYLKHPDLTAPGVDIYAPRAIVPGLPTADLEPNPVNPAWTLPYVRMSGTSMAVPHVSAAAALLLSENPQLSPDQLIDLLTTTTTPMPGYGLHEAGTGYLNALAAYEASLGVNGNLNAFLNGNIAHPIEEALGFDPSTLSYDVQKYSGFSLLGLLGLLPVDYPLQVNGDVAYIQAELNWTPDLQDAFDLQIIDPQGNIVAMSNNSFNLGETALAIPQTTGTYKVRVSPFLAIAANYHLKITTAYDGTAPAAATFDYSFNVTGITKQLLLLNTPADYFRSGDNGTVSFTFKPNNGTSGAGYAGSLRAVYVDRLGNSQVDEAIVDRNGGKYESRFRLNGSWSLAPGPIDVYLVYTGAGTVEPMTPARFYFNHLDVALSTNGTNHNPGNAITFNGTVKQLNSLAGLNIQSILVPAQVTVKLVDSAGTVLASKNVQANLLGKYNGSLVAPGGAQGQTTLIAEANHSGSFGEKHLGIRFPGNMAPEASLSAVSGVDANGNAFVHVNAEVADPDGANDVETIVVSLTDPQGNVVQGWQTADFDNNGDSWTLTGSLPLTSGVSWTVALTAVDSAGNTASSSQTVE